MKRRTALVLGVVAAVIVLGVLPVPRSDPRASAASYREAPLIAFDPQADNTDVFAFVSPDRPDTVTLIACYIPYEVPSGGPNFPQFGDDVLYRILIDNDGDAEEDITYEFRFTTTVRIPELLLYNFGPVTSIDDPTLNVRQTYSITRIDRSGTTVVRSDVPVAPINIGPRSFPDYDRVASQALVDLPGGGRAFAGPRDDPSFIDAAGIFDLLGVGPLGRDGLAGYNVHAIGLQLPIGALTRNGSRPSSTDDLAAVIGVWATASRRATTVLNADGTRASTGAWVQVSRLGSPLVNEVIVPRNVKDRFNATHPRDDAPFLPFVTDPLLAVLLKTGLGYPAVEHNRADLVQVYATGLPGLTAPTPRNAGGEMLRLNVAVPPAATPDRLGLIGGDRAGFPNGRRPVDDVTDITLALVAGALVLNPGAGFLGDGVDANDAPPLSAFPYLAPPWPGNR